VVGSMVWLHILLGPYWCVCVFGAPHTHTPIKDFNSIKMHGTTVKKTSYIKFVLCKLFTPSQTLSEEFTNE